MNPVVSHCDMWAPWFAGKSFTEDWASPHFGIWAAILSNVRDQKVQALEIGSFEGRSAVFWLEYLPNCHLTCVDAFEHGLKGRDMEAIRARFDKNVAEYGPRVTKLKVHSPFALATLKNQDRKFDLIYIDGSHLRDDVLVDTLLSWPLLKSQGVLIWDDYGKQDGLTPSQRPKEAIELFLSWYAGDYIELHRGWQVIVRKI